METRPLLLRLAMLLVESVVLVVIRPQRQDASYRGIVTAVDEASHPTLCLRSVVIQPTDH